MNKLIVTTLTLLILNLPAFGSCFVKVEKGGEYRVQIWKHRENPNPSLPNPPDEVKIRYCSDREMSPIAPIMAKHKAVTIIFNDGVFTSLKFADTETKRWANLSNGEKDMIEFIHMKFNILEK